MAVRICLAITCVFAVLTAQASGAVAPVGTPPTNQDPRCSFPQACTDPIVVASNDATPRPVEMVGYLFHKSLCVGLDVDARQQGSLCGVQRARTDAIENLGQVRNNDEGGPAFTYTYGALSDDVASLDVTYSRNGSSHRALPVIAFIRDELQQRLEQSEPFTGFVVLARGCVPIREFRFVARDAAGNVLQRLRSPGQPQPEAKPRCRIAEAPSPPASPAPIGGPPTRDHSRCPHVLRPCGDPLVIGSERSRFGPIEIVAFTAALGLCVDVDVLGGSAGTCPNEPPRSSIDVTGTAGSLAPNDLVYTQLLGTTKPEVSEVSARYLQYGSWTRTEALVARIEGDLQTRLDQPQPFGVFVITVPSCVEAKRFRVTARAADGSVLERTRGPSFGGHDTPCDGGVIEPYQGAR